MSKDNQSNNSSSSGSSMQDSIQDSVIDLLAQLSQYDIKLWLEEGQLRFNAPKGALTPDLREKIVALKPNIIAFLEANQASAILSSLSEFDLSEPYKPSLEQQRLWFIHKMVADEKAYNVPIVIKLQGNVDLLALEHSLINILKKHQILNAIFFDRSGSPEVRFNEIPEKPLSVYEIDETTLTEKLQACSRHCFDLESGPLYRFDFFKISNDVSYLSINIHHIVTDGWSMGVLQQDLKGFYAEYLSGNKDIVETPKTTFINYIAWQISKEQVQQRQKQVDFWLQSLCGVDVLEIPTDRPRPAYQTYAGRRIECDLPVPLIPKLREFASSTGNTLFGISLTVFYVLLNRYSRQSDICVGVPFANRPHPDLDNMIGFFVNTLALRVDISDDPIFDNLLSSVKKLVQSAQSNQSAPFDMVVEGLRLPRDQSRNPLVQVMFLLNDISETTTWAGGVNTSLIPGQSDTSKFDFSWEINDFGARIALTVEYNTDLFEAATIEQMLDCYINLISSAVIDPKQNISQLQLIKEADIKEIISQSNSTLKRCEVTESVVSRFNNVVSQFPEAIAVRIGAEELSYKELNKLSNQLANYIIESGVDKGGLVGLHINRSSELIIGLLAILKAGAGYLPLDPSLPEDRLEFILSDAGVKVVLTENALKSKFSEFKGKLVMLDEHRDIWQKAGDIDIDLSEPESLAYVIYTSGSTGKPKGVEIQHYNVVRLFDSTQHWFGFDQSDVWTLFHSFGFDFSVWEIWGALLFGGKLVIVPEWTAKSPEKFHNLLLSEKVTVLNQTPSAFYQLIHADSQIPKSNLSLRYVIFGGEALNLESLRSWFERYGGQQPKLINMYGITETTVHVTYREITQGDLDQGLGSVIGVPIPDLSIYLLDDQLNLVPTGVPGEICVGGAGLSKGYLDRPELTSSRFIDHPYIPGEKLYRSGDLARYRHNEHYKGLELEYLGRIDFQVKLRGFRIELGEIETEIARCSGIRESVVLLRDDLPGDSALVGYYSLESEVNIGSTEIRDKLRESLPEYMVPTFLVEMDQFPLNHNGKIDRKILPIPEVISDAEYVAPRSEIEQIIVDIWCDLLKLEHVGVLDNFFELGGHSLLVTQVLSRIHSVFERALDIRMFFNMPTIAQISEWLTENEVQNNSGLPKIEFATRSDSSQLSFSQKGLWFVTQLEDIGAAYSLPALYNFSGKVDFNFLENAFIKIIERHQILRANFTENESESQQKYKTDFQFELGFTDKRSEGYDSAVKEAQRLISIPFDLSNDLLIRGHLIQFDSNCNLLLINIHHIVADGWSMGVLLHELSVVYAALIDDVEIVLPELPVQYVDYVNWQRKYLGDLIDHAGEYWKNKLRGAPDLLELPYDKPRPSIQGHRGNFYRFAIPNEISKKVEDILAKHSVTPFMVYYAVYVLLLGRLSGNRDIVIGSPVANRPRPELENLIGYFVNMLPLRVQLDDKESFSDFIKRVKQESLEAWGHQSIPLDQIIERLNIKRTLSHSPLFQVVFTFEDHRSENCHFPGIDLEVDYLPAEWSKFDITLAVFQEKNSTYAAFEYNIDLFSQKTIRSFSNLFINLLESLLNRSDSALFESEWLTDNQIKDVIEKGSGDNVEFPELCLHQLFKQQVEARPDHPACDYNGEVLTYKELDERSNQICNYLIDNGLDIECRVGISLPKSNNMIAAVLGVMKAGGAYVALDPNYPKQRLEYIFDNAGIEYLIASKEMTLSEEMKRVNTLVIDEEGALSNYSLEDISAEKLDVGVSNLAYVIYTSGSTGVPKGVLVEHRGIANLQQAQRKGFDVEANDRVLQFASINFDAFISEVAMTFCAGATLVLLDQEVLSSPDDLSNALAKNNVTLATLPPAVLSVMDPKKVPITKLISAGEACNKVLVDSWAVNRKMINAYGPSEVSVCTSLGECMPDNDSDPAIGTVIDNLNIYVLDEQMRVCPFNVVGELYIGGVGLARGYLARPDLTAERFLPDPYANSVGLRVYRTGDLVKIDSEGVLHFIGRNDFQIKLRGYRIELGEIESLIHEHEKVNQAVVLKHNEQLVAFVVIADESEQIDLNDFLKDRLPDYMVPSRFLILDSIPLTSNGKVDREKLLDQAEDEEFRQEYIAPESDTEKELAKIWSGLLEQENIGVLDSFFELGGHSLLATRVCNEIVDNLGVNLTVRDIFATPVLADLAKRIDEIQVSFDNRQGLPLLESIGRDKVIPLSFAQQRLWFLEKMYPAQGVYNTPLTLNIDGEVDRSSLENAINRIVARHEILRTVFGEVDNKPCQIIIDELRIDLEDIDFSQNSPEKYEEQVKEALKEFAFTPLDLSQGPLLRAGLVRLPQHQILCITMHHIVSDGWSVSVLLDEIEYFYNSFEQNNVNDDLSELPIQYADFSIWQRNWLKDNVLNKQLDYWRRQLEDVSPLDINTDYPRPAVQSFNGAKVEIEISDDLVRSLEAIVRDTDATLFMLMLAAYEVLLYRYSGQTDFAVGTAIANRHYQNVERLIGFFVNTLAFRTSVKPNLSFDEILRLVKSKTLEAYENQDLPFEHLIEALDVVRDTSKTPVFQTQFVMQNLKAQTLDLNGVKCTLKTEEYFTAKFDLSLFVTNLNDSYVITGIYNSDLFKAETVSQLLQYYIKILNAVVTNQKQPIAEIPLLEEKEILQIANYSGDFDPDFDTSVSIIELFEKQVDISPQAIAIKSFDESISYIECDQRANQVAAYLKQQNVAPDDSVALCMGRSIDLIITILGILKAGATYLPLEASYPDDRLYSMLDVINPNILIVTSDNVDRFKHFSIEIIEYNKQAAAISEQSKNRNKVEHSECRPAYVMFTSGSTGKPKGIAVSHSNIIRLVSNPNFMEVGSQHTQLFLAPVAFDASTLELWAPLLNGGSIGVPAPGQLSLEQISDAIDKLGITTLWLTAALFQDMVDYQLKGLKPLKQLLAGGDVLSVSHVKKVLDEIPGITLINGYGPTENTTFTCCNVMSSSKEIQETVPIGKPITNTSVHILDTNMQHVPLGVAGELYAGGYGVALGYVGQTEETSQYFVQDPFSKVPGMRLYRTGDKVRMRPDGIIEFLGRIDQQVKIRGFRIEPGEIETVMKSCIGVEQSAVIVRDDMPGGKQLVGYYVVKNNENDDLENALYEILSEKLPEYMVPAALVRLPKLPKTANGKLDRKELPKPESTITAEAITLPRTATEKKLSDLFIQLLKLDQDIGIEQNFFKLGGHSLLAAQLVSRIQSEFDQALEVRTIFNRPSIVDLAEIIDSPESDKTDTTIAALKSYSVDDRIPLSFAQEGLWLIDQIGDGGSAYNIPLIIRLDGNLDIVSLEAALESLIDRHEILRSQVCVENGEPYQVIRNNSSQWQLGILDFSSEEQGKVDEYIESEFSHQFNLSSDLLIRGSLIKTSENSHILAIIVHHIVFDGWSLAVFADELEKLYVANTTDTSSNLEPLPYSYKDYCFWQRDVLKGQVLDSLIGYWKEQFLTIPDPIELPLDKTRPSIITSSGNCINFRWDSNFVNRLTEFSSQHQATLFMTLMSGYVSLLARYSGQDDICVGTPVANRTQTSMESLIGYFVNSLPIRASIEEGVTFTELLQQIRKTTLDGFAHQMAPFETIVESLNIKRQINRNPLFQVFMTLQNLPFEAVTLPGLKFEPITLPATNSKFEMNLTFMHEGGDLVGEMEFNTDLFEEHTIKQFLEHLKRFFECVLNAPEKKIQHIPLLSEAETGHIYEQFGRSTEYPEGDLIELFADAVGQFSSRPALTFGNDSYTYAELDTISNQWARELQSLGVHVGSTVGVKLERSAESIVALIAIIKSGAVFVPIDPKVPDARLEFLINDANLSVVLVNQMPNLERNERVILLDAFVAAASNNDNASLDIKVDSSDAAYIIYTSGSTGQPKGVVIEHRNVLYLWKALGEVVYSDNETALNVAVNAPLTFDASVKQWQVLFSGHHLVILDENERLDPELFVKALQNYEVDVFDCTPSHLKALLDYPETKDVLVNVDYILIGGEAIDEKLWREISVLEHTRCLNVYGPTECTVDATCEWVTLENLPPSIGSAIGNTLLMVIDSNGNLVPEGVSGELCIAGAGVGREYLNRPDLTEKVFVNHEFEPGKKIRLYKTGDLVRQRRDGKITYLGRIDHQVKIRGFRIEIGEIESILSQNDLVKDVVVDAKYVNGDERSLVAYIVPYNFYKEGLDKEEFQKELVPKLRSICKKQLPDYMEPAYFVIMDQFPKTVSGKVHRKSLPIPEAIVREGVLPPQNETQQILFDIWSELLGHQQFGVDDDFFELGGHSLLATRMSAWIRNKLSVNVSVAEIFSLTTIIELEQKVSDLDRCEELPPINKADREKDLPLSYAQQRLWFLDQLEGGSATYNMPACLNLSGNVDIEAVEKTFRTIIKKHEALRTVYRKQDQEPVQIILNDYHWSLEQHDMSELSNNPAIIQKYLHEQVSKPFDLKKDLMLRAILIRLSSDEHLLFMNIHHIAADGWSMRVIESEFKDIYSAIVSEATSNVEDSENELPIQYADYSVWQREWLDSGGLSKEYEYWQSQLSGVPGLLNLPTDRPRPKQQTYNGASEPIEFAPGAIETIRTFAKDNEITHYMLMLSVFGVLLSRRSGQDLLAIGTPTANRIRPEFEPIIGFFANTLVMKVDLTGNPTFTELVRRVKAATLGAYSHQNMPFDLLVDNLKVERNPSYTPLFQVMFGLQEVEDQPEQSLPIEMTQYPIDSGEVARFDLMLSLLEKEDSIQGVIEYNTDLFDHQTIIGFKEQISCILTDAINNPNNRIDEITMFDIDAKSASNDDAEEIEEFEL